MPHHVFRDCRFGDVDAQLQQLAMNPRCTPGGLLRLIIRISSRTSCGTPGRPGLPQRIFHLQNKRNPFRCQATTVSALTIIKALLHSLQTLRRQAQKIRSAVVNLSRFGAERRSTTSCCRSARFSSRSCADVLNAEARHGEGEVQVLLQRPEE